MPDPNACNTLRIAIVAEHASARFGGEAMLPLQYFKHLRRRGMDVHLIVHIRTKNELDEVFPDATDRIHYVPDTWYHRTLYQIAKRLPHRIRTFSVGFLMHLITQAYQRRIVRRLVRERGINIVHEPIPVSPRLPSLMVAVGAPVLIGPLNGGMTFPPAFKHYESFIERHFLRVGRALTALANWLIPGKRRAAVVLVANQRTRAALPGGLRGQVHELVDNAVDEVDSAEAILQRAAARSGPVRFIFVGRLIRLKGVDMLLEAFAAVTKTDTELHIVGDGPQRPALEQQAAQLGIRERVHFVGFVPHTECLHRLRAADVFVFPSVHDCGGAAVLEAMSVGLPVIAIDWGGPADYVCTRGDLIPPDSRIQVIQGLSNLMERYCDTVARTSQGRRARDHVHSHYTWEYKINSLITLYHQTLY